MTTTPTTATIAPPTLTFDAAEHRYELHHQGGGVEALPSVTTILRAAGLIDFSGVPSAVLAGAQARGTRVHTALHYAAEGTLDWSTVSVDDRPYVDAGMAFLATAQFQPLAMEHRMWHPVHRFCGTCDLVGWWGDSPAVGDYKTGRASDVAADLQLAAYAACLRATPPIEWMDVSPSTPIVRVSIELTKRGTFRTEVYRNPNDFATFLACLTVYREQERRGLLPRRAA